ncbi:MAG: CvpA family protein [Peptococcaceae bacterium]|nr:CvpA family protein [Peptococcaceae bacterium]
MNTFDIIMLTLLVLGGIIGFRKGLITGFTRFVGKILAIGFAFAFHNQFAIILEDLFGLRKIIESTLGGILMGVIDDRIASDLYGNSDNLFQPAVGLLTAISKYIILTFSIVVLFLIASCFINLIINLIISPAARKLGLINRGGGFAFGVLSAFIVLCLFIGLFTPFLTLSGNKLLSTGNSLLYPLMLQGYDLELSVFSSFSEDILTNYLYSLPLSSETSL